MSNTLTERRNDRLAAAQSAVERQQVADDKVVAMPCGTGDAVLGYYDLITQV